MKSSSRKSPPPTQPLTKELLTKEPRKGGGYKLGPRSAKPLPPDAVWATASQVRARYGNVSDMWISRKLMSDADFPRPSYNGALRVFSVAELEAYDRKLLTMKTSPLRNRKAAGAAS